MRKLPVEHLFLLLDIEIVVQQVVTTISDSAKEHLPLVKTGRNCEDCGGPGGFSRRVASTCRASLDRSEVSPALSTSVHSGILAFSVHLSFAPFPCNLDMLVFI